MKDDGDNGGGGALTLDKLNLEGGEAWLVNKQRVCRECERGEVEDVNHWLLSCPTLAYSLAYWW